MKKCWCGKDHTGHKPVDEKEVIKEFAKEMKDEIDKKVLEQLFKLTANNENHL